MKLHLEPRQLGLLGLVAFGVIASANLVAKEDHPAAATKPPYMVDNDFLVAGHSLFTDQAVDADNRGAKILVALNAFTLTTGGKERRLQRGDVMVGAPADAFTASAGADYYFVTLKRHHPVPRVAEPSNPPQKNITVHEAADFTVYIETLVPGDARPPHTHNTRLTININETDLRNDRGQTFHQIPEEVKFVSESQNHRQLTNVGALPLRNVVIEFRRSVQP